MAERQGFEPWKEVSPLTRLAGERLQPARPSLPKTFDKAPFLPNFFVRFQIFALSLINLKYLKKLILTCIIKFCNKTILVKGGMAEWLKAAVLKTVERKLRGFESYSLRQNF